MSQKRSFGWQIVKKITYPIDNILGNLFTKAVPAATSKTLGHKSIGMNEVIKHSNMQTTYQPWQDIP